MILNPKLRWEDEKGNKYVYEFGEGFKMNGNYVPINKKADYILFIKFVLIRYLNKIL